MERGYRVNDKEQLEIVRRQRDELERMLINNTTAELEELINDPKAAELRRKRKQQLSCLLLLLTVNHAYH